MNESPDSTVVNASIADHSNIEQRYSDTSDVEDTVEDLSSLKNQNNSVYSKEVAIKNEQRLQQALLAMKTRGLSLRAAADEYKVKHSTLFHRSSGREAMVNGNAGRRTFETAEEETLRSFLIKAASYNKLYSKAEVIDLGSAIYQDKMADSKVTVGRTWFKNFMTRYPELRLIVGQNLDAKRFAAQSPEKIERWIALSAAHISKFHIHNKDVYNFDETAFQIGETSKSRMLTSTEIRNSRQKKIFEKQEWVSSFECINTAGEALPPYIVFKGESIMQYWIEDLPLHADWRYDYSSTGLTNDEVALRWLEKMFIPHVANKRHGEYVLLVLDYHSSHCSPKFCELCEKNNIIMLILPAHTSHILQPLDVLCFTKLKELWGEENAAIQKYASATITKNQFLRHYQTARQGAFTSEVILDSFAKAGLQPLDAQRVINKVAKNPLTAMVANTSQVSQETREADNSEISDSQTQSNAQENSDTGSLDTVSSLYKALRQAISEANSSPEKRFWGRLADGICQITTANTSRIKDLVAEREALRQELAAEEGPKRKHTGEGGDNQQAFAEGQENHEENFKRSAADRAKDKRRKFHEEIQNDMISRLTFPDSDDDDQNTAQEVFENLE